MADFIRTIEGRTILVVPYSSITSKVPSKMPAFFNPAAKLNRDLSILAYGAFAASSTKKTFADSFTGIGARGLRVAVEVPAIEQVDRKSTRLNSSHANISYAVFCLKKKKIRTFTTAT